MKISVVWLRRDLRLVDNRALDHALASEFPVLVLFIFDEHITGKLPPDDPRLTFIHQQLDRINGKLSISGSSLLCCKGEPVHIWEELTGTYDISEVFINGDYEPYAIRRDHQVKETLERKGIKLNIFKDQVIFEKDEIIKTDGTPYTVFTPYKKRWLTEFRERNPLSGSKSPVGTFYPVHCTFPSLGELGFKKSSRQVPDYDLSVIPTYSRTRDLPVEKTTLLGPHLRFGTVSIRQLIRQLEATDIIFLGELIWREFFMQILWHFPGVMEDNFNPKYNRTAWRNHEDEFARWCNGETGYPFVDAGMRELNSTGFMHNRVRMITAGFMCKHLLTDWRWGEAYFAEKLLDYELSSNNGNWQWAAGTGCDAAPYFRIFNPDAQLLKFDRQLEYVKKWVPEYGTVNYPKPIVEHRFARERALKAYRGGMAD
jgi:deoxyribodipyrimidine photo-lyase